MTHPDAPLAARCREAYLESEDFGLFAVATESKGGEATITFVGSKNLVDWLFNLRFGMVRSERFGGLMHEGFADLYSRAGPSIRSMVRRHWRPGQPLVITGHSLGGVLATLTASRIRTAFPFAATSIELATFGTPRIFDSPAQARLGPLIAGRHYRCGLDPIPYRPSAVPGVMPYVNLPGLRQLPRPAVPWSWPRLWPRSWHDLPWIGDHAVDRYEAALGGPVASMRMGEERRETMRIEWEPTKIRRTRGD